VTANPVGMPYGASPQADAAEAWSRRVRRIGGLNQVTYAFVLFWLIRGDLAHGNPAGLAVLAGALTISGAAAAYGIRASAGKTPRPASSEGRRLERAIIAATAIQFAASFAAPVAVAAAGHSDWVVPSIAVTIGPLLLWVDHRIRLPRYRFAGWALTLVPFVLMATMSGKALAVTAGLGTGLLLLATATAGFRDLAQLPYTTPPGKNP
jgi:CDP-diglyceride synthetase